ncbi:hypothetical protein HK096_008782 [Nowakowskiella sp. JEL0078]|nr:hypothetical protein HK096_008782 [Nowakowskiella sp. JEL0078]
MKLMVDQIKNKFQELKQAYKKVVNQLQNETGNKAENIKYPVAWEAMLFDGLSGQSFSEENYNNEEYDNGVGIQWELESCYKSQGLL